MASNLVFSISCCSAAADAAADDVGFKSDFLAEATDVVVAESLTPYCIAASQADPSLPEISDQLASSGAYLKRGIIEKTGWATPLGSDKSHRQLAEACLVALENES